MFSNNPINQFAHLSQRPEHHWIADIVKGDQGQQQLLLAGVWLAIALVYLAAGIMVLHALLH